MAGILEQLNADYGARQGGAPGVKAQGFFGPLHRPDGGVSTELSFDFDFNGQKIYAPLLTPNLSKDEVTHLLAGHAPTPGIYQKAQEFALQRVRQGLSPFAANQEQRTNIGQPAVPANQDPMFAAALAAQLRGGR